MHWESDTERIWTHTQDEKYIQARNWLVVHSTDANEQQSSKAIVNSELKTPIGNWVLNFFKPTCMLIQASDVKSLGKVTQAFFVKL